LGSKGIEDFKSHPWLKDVDWKGMESKTIELPDELKHNLNKETKCLIDRFTMKSIDEHFLHKLYSDF